MENDKQAHKNFP